MKAHFRRELFRATDNTVVPAELREDMIHKPDGTMNWTKLRRYLQESIDEAKPGRVERIYIQIQG